MKRTLIRNATVLSMDPAIGDLHGADVLIAGDRIAEVARSIGIDDAEVIDASGMIAIPGLVNAHIHTWEFPLRGIGANWVSKRDYHGNMHRNMAMHFKAEDVRIANLLGALNQINHGATTIFDWCHIVRDAEMTDAAIEGLEESGIRAVFARGTVKPPVRDGQVPYYDIPFPREEIRRLRTGRLASDDRLVTLAMAILGPDYAAYDVCVQDIRLAREYGLVNSAHTWARKGQRKLEDGMWRLAKEGLLGPDHNIAHGNCLEDDELKMVLDAGCTVSATNFTEMFNSERVAMLGRLLKLGHMPSLGSDCDPYFNGSMMWVMRHAFQHQREIDNRILHEQGKWPAVDSQHATHTRDALEWATTGGAKMLRMEHRIGSITPGKQADLVLINARSMNVFPVLPGGDAAHAVVLYAEAADIDTVMIAGRPAKRGGKLLFPETRLAEMQDRLLASRERIMRDGSYVYQPAPRGPRP
ncbi:MAG: amidohydrolase family protein [Burkholderiales bacterium]|nr:amidohydrolase family protein [Burkholderiales bacterium]